MDPSVDVAANNEQWFMTTQGATVYGVAPEGGESESWRFTILLRDAIYGLPQGVNHQEWKEWVEHIYAAWLVSTNSITTARYYLTTRRTL